MLDLGIPLGWGDNQCEADAFGIADSRSSPSEPSGRLTRTDMRPYQNRFIELVKQCFATDASKLPGILLALEPGAGKTAVVLTAAKELIEEGAIERIVVVAPLLVSQTTWPDEFDEWEHLKDMTYTLLRVEDDDPELVAYDNEIYPVILAKWQGKFDEEVKAQPVLKPQQARAAVRYRWLEAAKAKQSPIERRKNVKPKSSPSALADEERNGLVLKRKYEMLARLAAERTQVHIINKEALPWLWQNAKEKRNWAYDGIFCDDLREGRGAVKRVKRGKGDKTPGPAPLSRFGVLSSARNKSTALIQLTGTPTPKGLENLWGLSYLIDHGERLGTDKTPFLDRWFTTNEYSRAVKPQPHAFDEIIGKIKDIMFSIDPKELGELPELIKVPMYARLPRKVQEEYNRFKRTAISEQYDVEAVNNGVLHNKLLQFANGSMYDAEGNDVWIHDSKIDMLRELVESLDGTPLLVAYDYEFDVNRILKAFPQAVRLCPENAVESKRLWNLDKIPLLLAHRASAGHGLNMQKGTGHMCEYGLTTDAELFIQFCKRLQRPGRKTTIFNHIIMAEGTIDEEVYPMYLDPRIETQDRILQAIRLQK
jgi:hypothetical protein